MSARALAVVALCILATLLGGYLVAWGTDRTFFTELVTSELTLDRVSGEDPQQALSIDTDVLDRALEVSAAGSQRWSRATDGPLRQVALLPAADLACRSLDVALMPAPDATDVLVLMLLPQPAERQPPGCEQQPWQLSLAAGDAAPALSHLQPGDQVQILFRNPGKKIRALGQLSASALRATRLRRAPGVDPVWLWSDQVDAAGQVALTALAVERAGAECADGEMALAAGARIDLSARFVWTHWDLLSRWALSRLAWVQGGIAAVIGIGTGLLLKGEDSRERPVPDAERRRLVWRLLRLRRNRRRGAGDD